MEIVTNDPPLVEQGFEFPPYVRVASLTALLAESSVITVHVPLVQGGKYPTVRLLRQAQLQQSAAQLIIQTSRGGVIVERALLERSRSGVALWTSGSVNRMFRQRWLAVHCWQRRTLLDTRSTRSWLHRSRLPSSTSRFEMNVSSRHPFRSRSGFGFRASAGQNKHSRCFSDRGNSMPITAGSAASSLSAAASELLQSSIFAQPTLNALRFSAHPMTRDGTIRT
jgi:hypothetical protein